MSLLLLFLLHGIIRLSVLEDVVWSWCSSQAITELLSSLLVTFYFACVNSATHETCQMSLFLRHTGTSFCTSSDVIPIGSTRKRSC
jgi:hypothetical protein